MKSSSFIILFLAVIAFFLLISFDHRCNKLGDGRYKVHFQTEGFDDYELIISNDKYTKILEDGSAKTGKLEWRQDCILILTDPSEPKDSLAEKIEAGLGNQCMQLLRKKGRAVYFRTTRLANLNIVINEGLLIRLK